MKALASTILALLSTALLWTLASCAAKPLDPSLFQGHQAFTSKLTLPQ